MDIKTEKFIKLFNQLEEILEQKSGKEKYEGFGVKLFEASIKDKRLDGMKSVIKRVNDLRNIIDHENKYIDKAEIAIPCDWVIEDLEHIIDELTNPQRARDIATKNVHSCSPDESISKVIKEMSEKTFTHVPVLSDGKFIGLLTESAILNWLGDKAEDGGFVLVEKTIKELEKYYKDDSRNDYCLFVSKEMDVLDVKEKFTNFIKDGRRLGVLFVTQNGKESEKIIGLITAWDLGKIKIENW
jgi:CBS domain-containing protein